MSQEPEEELSILDAAELLGLTTDRVRQLSIDVEGMSPEDIQALRQDRIRGRKKVARPFRSKGWVYAPSEIERFAAVERPAFRPPAGRDLAMLKPILEQVRALKAERAEDDLILEARAAGATLTEIGNALGITREAVRQRLAKLERPATPDARAS